MKVTIDNDDEVFVLEECGDADRWRGRHSSAYEPEEELDHAGALRVARQLVDQIAWAGLVTTSEHDHVLVYFDPTPDQEEERFDVFEVVHSDGGAEGYLVFSVREQRIVAGPLRSRVYARAVATALATDRYHELEGRDG